MKEAGLLKWYHSIQPIHAALVLVFALATSSELCDSAAFAAADETSSNSPEMTIAQCQRRISHHFSRQVVAEAYHQIGIRAVFIEMPCRRAIELANRGIYDGEVGKIPGTTYAFSNLIAVESPIFFIEGVAFTKSVSKEINNWDDLRGLKIGIVSGQLFAEHGTKGMQPIIVSDFSQLVSLLEIDRIDIGIGLLQNYQLMHSPPTRGNSKIRIIGKPLFTAPLFHIIHKKHEMLIPELTKTLNTMRKTGRTAEIHQNTLQNLKESQGHN